MRLVPTLYKSEYRFISCGASNETIFGFETVKFLNYFLFLLFQIIFNIELAAEFGVRSRFNDESNGTQTHRHTDSFQLLRCHDIIKLKITKLKYLNLFYSSFCLSVWNILFCVCSVIVWIHNSLLLLLFLLVKSHYNSIKACKFCFHDEWLKHRILNWQSRFFHQLQ